MASRRIHSEGRDTAAVSRAVADIEEPPGGREVDLGARRALAMTDGQSGDRLRGREGAIRAIEPVGGDAAALLVREINDLEARVMNVVAGADEILLFNALRPVRTQPTGLSVEAVLQYHVRAGIIFRRLQHIVLDARNMGHEGEAVGRICCDRMCPDGGFLLVNGSRANVAVRRDRIYRDIAALVIGAKHKAA